MGSRKTHLLHYRPKYHFLLSPAQTLPAANSFSQPCISQSRTRGCYKHTSATYTADIWKGGSQTGRDHRRDWTRHELKRFLLLCYYSFHLNITRTACKSVPDTSSSFSRGPGPFMGSTAQLLVQRSNLLVSTPSSTGKKCISPVRDLLGIRAQFRCKTSNHKAALKPAFPLRLCCNRGSETHLEIQKCLG